jgi:hypothetical protein
MPAERRLWRPASGPFIRSAVQISLTVRPGTGRRPAAGPTGPSGQFPGGEPALNGRSESAGPAGQPGSGGPARRCGAGSRSSGPPRARPSRRRCARAPSRRGGCQHQHRHDHRCAIPPPRPQTSRQQYMRPPRSGGACPLRPELLRALELVTTRRHAQLHRGQHRAAARRPNRPAARRGLDTSHRTYGDAPSTSTRTPALYLPPASVPQVALIHFGLLVVLLRLVQMDLSVPLLGGSLDRALLGTLVPGV